MALTIPFLLNTEVSGGSGYPEWQSRRLSGRKTSYPENVFQLFSSMTYPSPMRLRIGS